MLGLTFGSPRDWLMLALNDRLNPLAESITLLVVSRIGMRKSIWWPYDAATLPEV
jgi:hypothetical protein